MDDCVKQMKVLPCPKPRWRFCLGTWLINDGLDIEGTKKDFEYVRWGFSFKAPINKSAISWRWLEFKIFNKVTVIRWTLPRFYKG